MFCHNFSQGNNFCDSLVSSLSDKTLSKWDLPLKRGAHSLRLHFLGGRKNKNGRVASPQFYLVQSALDVSVKVHLIFLLISESKFSGPRKFTL